jgi:argininosuccinate lyase
VVSKLTLKPARTGKAASGLLLATDAADYLVRKGMAFRHAHEVVGKMVRELLAAGRDFDDLTRQEWHAYSDLFGDDVAGAVSALASVRARRTPQSTHPDAVRAAIAETRDWLAAGR